MVWLRGFFITGLIVTTLAWHEVQAGETPPRPGADIAQKLIDDCWAISKDARNSQNTADMANGTYDTIQCMEGAIIDQTEILYGDRDISRQEIRKILDDIAMLRKYYHYLFERNRSCDPSCGTIQLVLYALPHARLLESMIRDTVEVYESENFKTNISNQDRRKARAKSK